MKCVQGEFTEYFATKCSGNTGILYDIFTALRGPDCINNNSSYVILQREITGRLRATVFDKDHAVHPGVVNTIIWHDGSTKAIIDVLKNLETQVTERDEYWALDHFLNHTCKALEHLSDAPLFNGKTKIIIGHCRDGLYNIMQAQKL